MIIDEDYRTITRSHKREQMSQQDIRDTIDQKNRRWTETFRQHDPAAMAAFYTEDAQFLPPNAETVHGRDGIEGLFKFLYDSGIEAIELNTGEVEQHGDRVIEVSTATVRGNGGQVLDETKYMVVWSRENGDWKMHRDIFNSSLPPQGG